MEGCLPLFPAIDWLSLFRMAAARLFAPKEDAKPVETVSISQQAAQILDTYGDTILRYAYSYLHNRSDTEEVLQDTLIQFLKTRPVFESDEHEKAWLLRVTLNCLKSHWRMAWRRHDTPLDDRIPFPEPEDSALDEALRRLTPTYRAAVHLFYCEGYTAEEIARMSGEKPSTIRTRLTRARAQLRELMKGELDDGFSQAVPRHE